VSGVRTVTVAQDDDGIRLDRWFRRHYPGLGHGRLAKLLRTGQVRLDGGRAKPGDRISAGQDIRLPPLEDAARQPPTAAKRRPAAPLKDRDIAEARSWVLYEDDSVIALNKPPGLATQGGPGVGRHVDGMLEAFRRAGDPTRPKLVHRLDKDTSGVLLIARTSAAAAHFAKQFKGRDTHKLYWAMVMGVPEPAMGKISAAMDKLPGKPGERMVVTADGKPARTLFAVQDRAAKRAAWLALQPLTGRTHQLRLHCAHIGHPIVGDGKYGGRAAMLGGQVSGKLHLHARRLRLPHPDGRMLDIVAPLPTHMQESWRLMGWDADLVDDPFAEGTE